MTMKTALAMLAGLAVSAPIPTAVLAQQREPDPATCTAIFDTYDSADRQIALLNAEYAAAAGNAPAQALLVQRIANWMLDKSNMLQLAQLEHCPLPAGRTFGPPQYQRQAERCLFDAQNGSPTSRNCDTTRWRAE